VRPPRGRQLAGAAAVAALWLAAHAPSGVGQSRDVVWEAEAHVGLLLDVPYVAQTEALCGGAAVAMSLRYWGDDRARAERFAPLLRDDGSGIETSDLARATAEMGWHATELRGDLGLIRSQLAAGRPLIALIAVGPERYHYVTVVGFVDGRVVFHDPAASPYRWMKAADFTRAWSASGFWTLLVLPPENRTREGPGTRFSPATDTGLPPREVREGEGPSARPAGDDPGDGVFPANEPCEAAVRRGVELARTDQDTEAARTLRAAAERCPRFARAHRELAALDLRQGRAALAAERAHRAVDLDPSDRHAIEILAASHYLDGNDLGALEAWGRIEPVILQEVTLGAPSRTRQPGILSLVGLEPGQILTPRALQLGRRRLAMLPAAAATRLDYRPLDGGGRAVATGAVTERPLYPSPSKVLVEGVVSGLSDRTLRLPIASPLGGGELWTFEWRWEPNRRRLGVGLSQPVGGALPGVFTLAGHTARETYALGPVDREERRRVEAGFATWLIPSLRASATVAADHLEGLGTFGALGVETRVVGLEDRAGLSLGGELWATSAGAAPFLRGRAEVDWRSSSKRHGVVAYSRLGGVVVSAGAPRTIWPGAGSGSGRTPLARGHDLLTNGQITGPLFGRTLVHGGLETVWWHRVGPIDVGGAVFVDLAHAARRSETPGGHGFAADAGLGLRTGLPGGRTFRLDVGRGLLDGATSLSAGLDVGLATSR